MKKEKLFTCYAGNERPKVRNDLPCQRLERVLDSEAVALNDSGFEGEDLGQAFHTGFEREKQVRYPSLLDSKERTNGTLLESKETEMCCLKEIMMILVFDFTSVEVFENFMVFEKFEDSFLSSFSLDLCKGSLYLQRKVFGKLGEQN